MAASFDNAAVAYDKTFTKSNIGKLQRAQVYSVLDQLLKKNKINTTLEINCGTGEDAQWLASKGLNVIATDISEKMLQVAIAKKGSGTVKFEYADINQIGTQYSGRSFDMIFSNFGGLNCLAPSELKLFFVNAAALLPKHGKLVVVIMPKNTLWEKIYFYFKGDLTKAKRRNSGKADVNVNGENVPTFYYNPQDVIPFAKVAFHAIDLKPIGLFVPPSYLEHFFKTKPMLLSAFATLDKLISNVKYTARYSDHYLIVFDKK
ncbi:MAG TPA: class I SAM-dependent methyltransferase [Flavobacterium sp.]|jgi:SAM-dependent methyltransferase